MEAEAHYKKKKTTKKQSQAFSAVFHLNKSRRKLHRYRLIFLALSCRAHHPLRRHPGLDSNLKPTHGITTEKAIILFCFTLPFALLQRALIVRLLYSTSS